MSTTTTAPTPPTHPSPLTYPLLHLPPELLLHLSSYLPYPDALALKHTHPALYPLIATCIRLKVSWLLDRKARCLSVPLNKCILKTDEAFCGCDGGEVRRIMEVRRAHGECGINGCREGLMKEGEEGEGEGRVWCEVVVGRRCEGPRAGVGRGVRRGRLAGWVGRYGRGRVSYRLSALGWALVVLVLAVLIGMGLRSSEGVKSIWR